MRFFRRQKKRKNSIQPAGSLFATSRGSVPFRRLLQRYITVVFAYAL